MDTLFHRELYLSQMRGFYHDEGLIKVVTGVRRCGKSSLMRTVAEELCTDGIPQGRIVFLDLDARGNRRIRTADALEELIEKSVPETNETIYLFIDEVQNVDGFEDVVNAYRNDGGFSIFITGSNSYLLSGELATKLTGRYIEFDMFPLNFREYLEMKRFLGKPVSPNIDVEFAAYVRNGGFPKTLEYDSETDVQHYVQSLVNEIFEKDIRRRAKVRHRSVFDAVRAYMVANYGAPTSLKNLLAHFRDVEGIPITRETLKRYIDLLVQAKVLYRCPTFDMKSKRSLHGGEKYYLCDLAFHFATATDNRISYGPAFENLVYLYARSHRYSASVGRIGRLECDFILRSPEQNYSYIQVAYTIADEATEEREYRPFSRIRDGWPRYLLTNDRLLQKRDGVIHANIADFMAENRKF